MTFTNLQYVADNIRQLRESKYYSQEYMAAKLGMCQNAYSKMELNKTRLTVERLFQIANLLDTDVLNLMQKNHTEEKKVA